MITRAYAQLQSERALQYPAVVSLPPEAGYSGSSVVNDDTNVIKKKNKRIGATHFDDIVCAYHVSWLCMHVPPTQQIHLQRENSKFCTICLSPLSLQPKASKQTLVPNHTERKHEDRLCYGCGVRCRRLCLRGTQVSSLIFGFMNKVWYRLFLASLLLWPVISDVPPVAPGTFGTLSTRRCHVIFNM